MFSHLVTIKSKPNQFYNFCRMSSKCTVSVCQFTATNNKENNLKVVRDLIQQSVSRNAKMVFLPEACDFVSKDSQELNKLSESLTGPLMRSYQDLAKSNQIWMSVGGFHEKCDEETIYNSHVVIDDKGDIKGLYRKIHLFDVSLPNKNINLRESESITGGSQISPPIETPAGMLGLSICYDLRFPEQSTLLRKLGADILTYPSAFTNETGRAHWEILLRARAVENQCYVIAAAQYGKHNDKRVSFGQSMVVDPWGQILVECPKYTTEEATNESIGVATIELDKLTKIRLEMPTFSHRRNDLYNLNINQALEEIENDKNYMFSDNIIPGKTVFYISKYSFAFTNIRCVVPGHVLIATKRLARRLHDLSDEETADLFQTAVKISKIMENALNAQSSTVCVQDGKFAGQTVPHVHVHVLPRKEGDFKNNDDIYLHLAKHDKEESVSRIRSLEEQIAEATNLRKYFYGNYV